MVITNIEDSSSLYLFYACDILLLRVWVLGYRIVMGVITIANVIN